MASPARHTELPPPCDLCRNTTFELIASRDRRGKPLDTCLCTQCGLVSHRVIPSDADLERFYTKDYRREYHGEETPSPRRVMRAWRNGERIFAQLRPYLTPGQRLIEIGAGIGCTVKLFQLHGWSAEGIDPNEGFLSYSRERLHAPVALGTVDRLSAAHPFDVILLVHVIEHFRSPRAALTHIRSLLSPDGHFYVECPNLAAPFAPRSKLFHFAHIHNFTPRTLELLATSIGFTPVARFGREDDANLQMLFRLGDPVPLDVSGSVALSRDALDRASPLSYYLRPHYMLQRCKKIAKYIDEYRRAPAFVREIEARCASATP